MGWLYLNVAIFWGRDHVATLKAADASQHGRFYPATASAPAAIVVTAPHMAHTTDAAANPEARPMPTSLDGFWAGWTTEVDVREWARPPGRSRDAVAAGPALASTPTVTFVDPHCVCLIASPNERFGSSSTLAPRSASSGRAPSSPSTSSSGCWTKARGLAAGSSREPVAPSTTFAATSSVASRAGARVPESDEIPFSSFLRKRALQYAAEEADRLLHNYIGTEHLLLGLLREERSVAAEVLAARGLKIEAVRRRSSSCSARGEQPEPPGPPPTPANTYQWPQIPFVPSRTVHILYSGMRSPQEPVINHAGTVFSAYGFTLEGHHRSCVGGESLACRHHTGLRDDARFDFLMVLPQEEDMATCLGLLQSAIEQQFAVHVKREERVREVYRVTIAPSAGQMLWRYPDPEPGTGFSSLPFSVFMGRSKDAPMFPLDPFAVHSMPFMFLVKWFEEILGDRWSTKRICLESTASN